MIPHVETVVLLSKGEVDSKKIRVEFSLEDMDMNKYIVENGFLNLDFMGNLGHSIVKTKGDRVYIEKGNVTKLGDVKYFTFEPHISFPDSKYGYKKENIYYFDENGLMEL